MHPASGQQILLVQTVEIDEPAGTPVAVVQEEDGFFLVEGKGVRGWVHSKYITLDLADEPESEEEKGE